jgi:D-glycero-D-manno-heptose 1,7-bisphosphate phosphatase
LIVGDKPADMEAGRRAGIRQGWLVDGERLSQHDFETVPLRSQGDLDALLEAISALAVSPDHP